MVDALLDPLAQQRLLLHKVSVWYDEKQILYEVSMVIPKKKITALIGPSGCGKSTLLRCLNRMNDLVLSAKVRGNILYRRKNILLPTTDVVELRRNIGMVFQKPNPFPMSVFENVAYGVRLQHASKDYIERIVRQSLEKADLWEEVKDKLHVSAFKLSGGQQQRLCIARALAIQPDVILLDEPCSALDPIATAKIERLLIKLKEEKTIIIVTHNMHQARRISDYTAYLLHGKLVEYGPTKQLFSKPKDKLTKDYLNGAFG
ncbi:MAG: phosphate ABC transporter ATP-binding protein PstB [archaeon]